MEQNKGVVNQCDFSKLVAFVDLIKRNSTWLNSQLRFRNSYIAL